MDEAAHEDKRPKTPDLRLIWSSFAKATADFEFDGLGDLEQRNPRDVVGRIYPECHSSRDSKEGRGRRERGKAERISNTPQADADANSKQIRNPN